MKKSRAVLILSYIDYPSYTGMSKRISGLVRIMHLNNVSVSVLAPIARSPTVIKPEIAIENVPVKRIDLRRFSSKGKHGSKFIQLLLFTIIASIKTAKEFGRYNSLIQYQTIYSAGPALFAKIFLKAKIIGDDIVLSNPIIDIFLLKLNNITITPSLKTFQLAKRLGKEVLYVPNGIDKAETNTVSPKFKPNMLFVGSFYFDQNIMAIENIVDLATALVSEGQNFKIAIVGGPIDRVSEFLEYSVVKNRFVVFLGNLTFEQLLEVYRSSSIGLLPFFSDIPLIGGQRTKALEFFAKGLVVISGSEGVKGITGIESKKHFFLANSKKEMCTIIKSCLETPKECLSIAVAGQEYVINKYSWNSLAKDYLEVIRN